MCSLIHLREPQSSSRLVLQRAARFRGGLRTALHCREQIWLAVPVWGFAQTH